MPKIVDHEERRAHIVQSVMNIIGRDGFDHATMRSIANEAGYAHGAISRYFPDKQSLLTAAFLHVFAESHERTLERAGNTRGLAALREFAKALLPYGGLATTQERVVLTFWSRAAQDRELEKIQYTNLRKRRDLIRRILNEAIEDGELSSDADIEEATNRVSAYVAGWQMLGVFVPEATTMESLDSSVEAFVSSLRKPCHEQ